MNEYEVLENKLNKDWEMKICKQSKYEKYHKTQEKVKRGKVTKTRVWNLKRLFIYLLIFLIYFSIDTWS